VRRALGVIGAVLRSVAPKTFSNVFCSFRFVTGGDRLSDQGGGAGPAKGIPLKAANGTAYAGEIADLDRRCRFCYVLCMALIEFMRWLGRIATDAATRARLGGLGLVLNVWSFQK